MNTALRGLLMITLSFLFLMFMTSAALDIISPTQSLRDGDTLVSSGGNFELGYFSPGSSSRRYVGIWFSNVSAKTVVWVANREIPLLNSSGLLQIVNESVVTLVNGNGDVLWSTNSSRSVQKPIAQLLDSGNFIVRDENDENPDNFLWQSFDYPCDSELPGMKLGKDLVTGFERFLTSWKSSDDPSPGSYMYRIDPHGYPQPFLYKDSVVQFREGPWDGVWFSGTAQSPDAVPETYKFIFNEKEISYSYELVNTSAITYRYLYPYGILQRLEWSNLTQGWSTLFTKPNDKCDTYGICGAYATCNVADSPQCQCMKGFVPKSPKDWNAGSWAGGCVRGETLNCSIHNGFFKIPNVKVPDTRNSWYNTTMTLNECSQKCLHNCSCVAYSNLDVTNGGIGCLLWFDALIDVKVFSGSGQNLYVRVTSSASGDRKVRVWIAVSVTLLVVIFLCGGIALIVWKRWKRRPNREGMNGEEQINNSNCTKGESELPVYAFDVIAHATNFFSHQNKLGEGGFGPVFKGVLSDGREVAVKRLSHDSRQGLNEFKNEILFIAKLQHRNLVKLMGYCIEADERMLIYEYMPNKSLDYFIFDQSSSELLDWPKRLDIINGIARGLVYLHQDSRLRIVHRDLKASNILLDSEMNPKISDFGLARTFDGVEDEARTKRVVGTYGYMPPEYTIDGVFSVKSDVYSFGVLVLEIVSGQRNRGFNHHDHHHNLLGHAWILFKEGEAYDVVDPLIRNASYVSEMQRAVHIGLLCVQQHPEERPSMPQVAVMLSSDGELPEPKEPGFYAGRNVVPRELVSSKTDTISSNNEITITSLDPR
ncbi:G-type lectin S-receptor-like serine/threonine-protein kinase At4g27290 isoform X2 [Silene latifolia]|uniref:G-type lectin S-receptor-like serine/threonine-protein kinase At4g27290 isoform X2 n=2 Tax=Silene latifolia TaxID=37657 RepID=UPI003D76C744